MATRTWNLDIENSRHSVRLVHTHFGGRREIWVDGVMEERGRKIIGYGSRHFIQLNG